MKLLVIGHTVKDVFTLHGRVNMKPGGIFYSVLTLSNLIDKIDSIFLATSLDEENAPLFESVYSSVKKDFFEKVESIPKVNLMHKENMEREEIYENITNNLNLSVQDFSSFDGILINMITGFDINLEQMKNIRKNYKGIIYFDVHTMSRGLDENYRREFRKIPDFSEWAKSIDILQTNERELLTLSDKKDKLEIISELFSYGIKIVIVTKDERGARIFSMKKNEIISTFASSIKVDVKNKIGCGDVFGATFFYNYIRSMDDINSLHAANKAAGFFVGCSDLNKLKDMKKYVFA